MVGTANAVSVGCEMQQSYDKRCCYVCWPWVMFGAEQAMGWRIALIVPGLMMLIVGAMYWKFTQDCPQGNFKELRAQGIQVGSDKKGGMAI